MEAAQALDIGRQGIQVALLISLPILAISLFLGLIVSVFQALTQVQEATLTFAPKLIGIAVMMLFLGNWMLTTLVGFFRLCFERVASVGL
jgi:flagellar biosynthetic protein FliQ